MKWSSWTVDSVRREYCDDTLLILDDIQKQDMQSFWQFLVFHNLWKLKFGILAWFLVYENEWMNDKFIKDPLITTLVYEIWEN
jgi:hypothetical protein